MRLALSVAPGVEREIDGQSERIALAAADALMLAWLAIEGPTPRARLAALMWPEKDAAAARNLLRQRLFRLRRIAGADLTSGGAVLTLADGLDHDLAGAHTVLAAMEGPLDVSADLVSWLERQRGLRRDAAVADLQRRVVTAQARGQWHEAVACAREGVSLQPLDESAHRLLIECLVQAGDGPGARDAYDACRQQWLSEWGVEPPASVAALLQQAPDRAVAAAVPVSMLRPPRLIGREREWTALVGAAESGRSVLVLGEAGMGKSRLASDFATLSGASVQASARPGDAHVVYGSLTRLLRALPALRETAVPPLRQELARLLPELGPSQPLESPVARTRFFNAVAAVLSGPATAPTCIVLDDLHFADQASLELLAYVVAQGPTRWVLAARPAELSPAGHALVSGLEQQGKLDRLELGPLSVDQIAELLASLDLPEALPPSLAPELAARCGGNPLFLLEALRARVGGSARERRDGRSVLELIDARLARLSAPAHRLMQCAALAMPHFDIELATQVLGCRSIDLADPWTELERAQVFREGAFAHDLIFERAVAAVPAAARPALHGAIAAVLQARRGEPARVAAHWIAAGDLVQARSALWQAATRASAAMRKREAFDAYRQAAQLAGQAGDDAARFEALLAAFDEAMVADRLLVDDTMLLEMEAAAVTPLQRLQFGLARTNLAENRGEFDLGVRVAEEAAELARSLGRTELEMRALRHAAACQCYSGHPDQAVALLRPALPWVMAHGSLLEQQEFLNNLGTCLDDLDQIDEAQACTTQSLELALRMGRLDQAAIACNNLTYSTKQNGRLGLALHHAAQSRRHVLGYDDARATSYATDLMEASLLRDLAHYTEALDAGERALRNATQNPAAVPTAHRHMACLWLHLGQLTRARQSLEASRAYRLPPHIRCRDAQLEGRLLHALGRPCGEAFARALADAPLMGRTLALAMITLDHALTLPPDEALAACESVIQRCQPIGFHGVVMAARIRACGFAARLPAGPARAAERARQVLATPEDIEPDDLYRGELWRNAALALQAAGDIDGARAAAMQGCEWVGRVAQSTVPEPFRDAFVHRQPVNRDLLALRARLAR